MNQILILIALLMVPFGGKKQTNEILKEHFTKSDIENLYVIVERFDTFVQNEFPGNNVNSSYTEFFSTIANSKSFIDVMEKATFKQKNANLLNDIELSTLKKIWQINLLE